MEETEVNTVEEKSNVLTFPPLFKPLAIERPEMHYYRYHVKGIIPYGENKEFSISFDNNFYVEAIDDKKGFEVIAQLHNGIDKWLVIEVEKIR